jgi:hypothetical protein
MPDWNAGFEASPAATDDASQGDDRIRELKNAISVRLAHEHAFSMAAPSEAVQGWHVDGSARCYVAAAAPTTKPDGTTALSAADNGRIWYDTATDGFYVYSHPDWVQVNSSADVAAHAALGATDAVHGAVSAATANTLVCRDAAGRTRVADPASSGDAATKFYVDTHAALTSAHSSTSAATADRIMRRDGSGRCEVATPVANLDVVNRHYHRMRSGPIEWNGNPATMGVYFYVGTYVLGTNATTAFNVGLQVYPEDSGLGYIAIYSSARAFTFPGVWRCMGSIGSTHTLAVRTDF